MSRSSVGAAGDLAGRLDAATRELGVALDAAQQASLLQYARLLDRWSATYNLSAIRGQDAILIHHLLDCLAIVPALQRWAGNRAIRVLDVGSGAGLPGVVLAIARAHWSITTIDAVGKKVAFVRQAAGELRLANLLPLHGRVERLPGSTGFDLIVSRAFASLSEFTDKTKERVAQGGVWVAMKARRPQDEIAELSSSLEVFHVEPLIVPGLDAERCLAWIRPC